MDFFDPKSDVLEVKLTPWGRYKLSKGGFRPTWYTFSDEGILYNSEFAGFSESQNSIQDRIQDSTPALKPLNVTEGVQTAITRRNEAIQKIFGTEIGLPAGVSPHPDAHHMTEEGLRLREEAVEANLAEINIPGGDMITPSSSPLFMNVADIYNREELQYTTNKMKGLGNPLGTSKLSSNKYPAFQIRPYLGEIASSSRAFTGSLDATEGTASIPQINITVKYNNYVAEIPDYTEDMGTNADFFFTGPTDANNLTSVTTDILTSGKYIVVQNGELVLGVQEKNTDFYKENFDIEVYLSSSMPDIDTRQLKFNTSAFGAYTTDDVQYYLDIRADNGIASVVLDKANIQDFTALGPDQGAGVLSTRQYFIKDLYIPEEDLCE